MCVCVCVCVCVVSHVSTLSHAVECGCEGETLRGVCVCVCVVVCVCAPV